MLLTIAEHIHFVRFRGPIGGFIAGMPCRIAPACQ
jgi:hypothetical protein